MNIEYSTSVWLIDEEKAISDIKQLEIGEECFYPESDYGHGFIRCTKEGYACYEIPMYGGEPQLNKIHNTAEEAFKEVISWT